jgi:hypothetical protein
MDFRMFKQFLTPVGFPVVPVVEGFSDAELLGSIVVDADKARVIPADFCCQSLRGWNGGENENAGKAVGSAFDNNTRRRTYDHY